MDAAHILPWSRFDLDVVQNGIALSKTCHWAFDAGVLRLSFAPAIGRYQLDIPEPVRASAPAHGFDLAGFEALCREPIPRANLPANRADWPDPVYITELNAELFD